MDGYGAGSAHYGSTLDLELRQLSNVISDMSRDNTLPLQNSLHDRLDESDPPSSVGSAKSVSDISSPQSVSYELPNTQYVTGGPLPMQSGIGLSGVPDLSYQHSSTSKAVLSAVRALQRKIQALEKDKRGLEEQHKNTKRALKSELEEAAAKHGQVVRDYMAEKTLLLEKNAASEARIRQLNTNQTVVEAHLTQQVELKESRLTSEAHNLHDENSRLSSQLEKLKKDWQKASDELQLVRVENHRLKADLEAEKMEKDQLHESVEEARQNERTSLQAQIAKLEKDRKSFSDLLNQGTSQVTATQQEIKESQVKVHRLQSRLDEAEAENTRMEARLTELHKTLEAEMTLSAKKIEEWQAKYNSILDRSTEKTSEYDATVLTLQKERDVLKQQLGEVKISRGENDGYLKEMQDYVEAVSKQNQDFREKNEEAETSLREVLTLNEHLRLELMHLREAGDVKEEIARLAKSTTTKRTKKRDKKTSKGKGVITGSHLHILSHGGPRKTTLIRKPKPRPSSKKKEVKLHEECGVPLPFTVGHSLGRSFSIPVTVQEILAKENWRRAEQECADKENVDIDEILNHSNALMASIRSHEDELRCLTQQQQQQLTATPQSGSDDARKVGELVTRLDHTSRHLKRLKEHQKEVQAFLKNLGPYAMSTVDRLAQPKKQISPKKPKLPSKPTCAESREQSYERKVKSLKLLSEFKKIWEV